MLLFKRDREYEAPLAFTLKRSQSECRAGQRRSQSFPERAAAPHAADMWSYDTGRLHFASLSLFHTHAR